MPYNNTPIVPSKEITGTTSLPLARVKKIIAIDDDIHQCSNNAAFVITVATEMFLQHLVEQAYNIVKAERKPRRNIQYRDVANAVSRVENLEFLTDVVPKTMTYKQFRAKQGVNSQAGTTSARSGQPAQSGGSAPGQGTLDGHIGRGVQIGNAGHESLVEGDGDRQATNGAAHDKMEVDEDSDATTGPPGKDGPRQRHDGDDDMDEPV